MGNHSSDVLSLKFTWLVKPASCLVGAGMVNASGLTVVFVKAACVVCPLCLVSYKMIKITIIIIIMVGLHTYKHCFFCDKS